MLNDDSNVDALQSVEWYREIWRTNHNNTIWMDTEIQFLRNVEFEVKVSEKIIRIIN